MCCHRSLEKKEDFNKGGEIGKGQIMDLRFSPKVLVTTIRRPCTGGIGSQVEKRGWITKTFWSVS